MPKIVIENLFNLTIDLAPSTSKVIEIIHESGMDWMHACGKKGRCTTCKLIVLEGIENLSELTDQEIAFYNQGRLKANERLACQVVLQRGDIKVRVAEPNKFPHISYSE
ncbi:MAG: 2Fe-2S ferredoxin [Algoriphagus sp.]|jgi:2Fe-2S ferredoxin